MRTLTIQAIAEDDSATTVLTVATDAEPGERCLTICHAAVDLAQLAHPGKTLGYGWNIGESTELRTTSAPSLC